MTHVLIAGVSTRAAAESAGRAGYGVTAFDAYGDLDHHPSVHVVSLPRDLGVSFTAHAAARAARAVSGDAVAYLSSFENHPRAVRTLAGGRALWGNPPTFSGVCAIRSCWRPHSASGGLPCRTRSIRRRLLADGW